LTDPARFPRMRLARSAHGRGSSAIVHRRSSPLFPCRA
jgi:hypothetical protein